MPDHVAIGQPGADEYLDRIGAALPEATLTVVDAAPGWLADTDTTVVFTDQPPPMSPTSSASRGSSSGRTATPS